jgi:hypothetical protein
LVVVGSERKQSGRSHHSIAVTGASDAAAEPRLRSLKMQRSKSVFVANALRIHWLRFFLMMFLPSKPGWIFIRFGTDWSVGFLRGPIVGVIQKMIDTPLFQGPSMMSLTCCIRFLRKET